MHKNMCCCCVFLFLVNFVSKKKSGPKVGRLFPQRLYRTVSLASQAQGVDTKVPCAHLTYSVCVCGCLSRLFFSHVHGGGDGDLNWDFYRFFMRCARSRVFRCQRDVVSQIFLWVIYKRTPHTMCLCVVHNVLAASSSFPLAQNTLRMRNQMRCEVSKKKNYSKFNMFSRIYRQHLHKDIK